MLRITGASLCAMLALSAGPTAQAALPEPNCAHAIGASVGPGKIGTLPFGHLTAPQRTGSYYVPKYRPSGGRGLAVLFHGYQGNGAQMVYTFRQVADYYGIALLAPDARLGQWSLAKSGGTSVDTGHVVDSIYWMQRHAGLVNPSYVVAGGHSFGTRMAAQIGTTLPMFRGVFLSHGRYVPEALGPRKVPAYFSGSPADNQFPFTVTLDQWHLWPGERSMLRTFDCPDCRHFPQAQELSSIGAWVMRKK